MKIGSDDRRRTGEGRLHACALHVDCPVSTEVLFAFFSALFICFRASRSISPRAGLGGLRSVEKIGQDCAEYSEKHTPDSSGVEHVSQAVAFFDVARR